MTLNYRKYNHLMSLHFKGLMYQPILGATTFVNRGHLQNYYIGSFDPLSDRGFCEEEAK